MESGAPGVCKFLVDQGRVDMRRNLIDKLNCSDHDSVNVASNECVPDRAMSELMLGKALFGSRQPVRSF